ncbi:hypothetical protein CfE428DRAFT_1742 [Chthoniobacter flavus Ellin428]|uniref:Uncharacterized protein n=1 Tax=Chthoniobacter flavus Ellin428 TaxID=497964 RepID=B4CYK4_9BACT|nr:hypothetical protein [Chthoniobacter flavus]EDY20545.1 hypothetical protein CfE428DRAFT_1742 [Chthoniobacter flavus Ellin428]TCO89942.1 hypothetical protein EV701_112117 [Chthoniobacter flavus]
MFRWILILILVLGAFFAVRNWSTIMGKWETTVGQLPGLSKPSGGKGGTSDNGGNGKTDSPDSGIGNFLKGFAGINGWGNRTVAGITLDLPYSVSTYTPSYLVTPTPNTIAEYYRGGGPTRSLFIKHEINTAMAGGAMFAWANRSLKSEAQRLKMDIMSQNSATTVVNGYRARRIDMISRDEPRKRVRIVAFERGNQAWFVQFTTMESDPEAEQIYQRIANSAH